VNLVAKLVSLMINILNRPALAEHLCCLLRRREMFLIKNNSKHFNFCLPLDFAGFTAIFVNINAKPHLSWETITHFLISLILATTSRGFVRSIVKCLNQFHFLSILHIKWK
jgi:hypothetical protein